MAAPRLFAFGRFEHGELGLGKTTDSATPAAVAQPSAVATATASATVDLKSAAAPSGPVVSCISSLSGTRFTLEKVSWSADSEKLRLRSMIGRPAPIPDVTTSTAVTNAASPAAAAIASVESMDVTGALALACGQHHSALVDSSGVLWMWGLNSAGQTGHRELADVYTPTISDALGSAELMGKSIALVAAGRNHTIVVTADSAVYAWGSIGTGDKQIDQMNPRSIAFPKLTITGIACGEVHALALSRTGHVFSWGVGQHGRLGLGNEHDQTTPQLNITCGERGVASQISAGYYHSMAVVDGRLYTWGVNTNGQLGIGTTTRALLPILVPIIKRAPPQQSAATATAATAAADTKSAPASPATNSATATSALPVALPAGTPTPPATTSGDAVAAAAASTGAEEETLLSIAGGCFHSLVVCTNGHVYAWGNNVYGQLGMGDKLQRLSPAAIPYFFSNRPAAAGAATAAAAAKPKSAPSSPFGGTNDDDDDDSEDSGLERARRIACGGAHSVVVTAPAGRVYTFGAGCHGALGHGADSSNEWNDELRPRVVTSLAAHTIVAVAAGRHHTLALSGPKSALRIPYDVVVPPAQSKRAAGSASPSASSSGKPIVTPKQPAMSWSDALWGFCSGVTRSNTNANA